MCAIKEVRVISDDQNSNECLRQLNQVSLQQIQTIQIITWFLSSSLIFYSALWFFLSSIHRIKEMMVGHILHI